MAPVRPPGLRDPVRRAFMHGDMRRVCQQFRSGNIANLSTAIRTVIQIPLKPQIATVSDAFIELQEARHIADYDVTEMFTRLDVFEKIGLADRAFAAWRAIGDRPNANVFLAALLLERQWRGS